MRGSTHAAQSQPAIPLLGPLLGELKDPLREVPYVTYCGESHLRDGRRKASTGLRRNGALVQRTHERDDQRAENSSFPRTGTRLRDETVS